VTDIAHQVLYYNYCPKHKSNI